MANAGLLTALGTLGAGLSTYGRVQQEREALNRALEERDYARRMAAEAVQRQEAATQRQIEQQDLENRRQTSRDILEAALKGLRPIGTAGISIGGQQFQLPEVLTAAEQINQRKALFKSAYPYLSDAQAELLARGVMRPGEAIVDPGTMRRVTGGGGGGGGRTTTPPGLSPKPPANSPRQNFTTMFDPASGTFNFPPG